MWHRYVRQMTLSSDARSKRYCQVRKIAQQLGAGIASRSLGVQILPGPLCYVHQQVAFFPNSKFCVTSCISGRWLQDFRRVSGTMTQQLWCMIYDWKVEAPNQTRVNMLHPWVRCCIYRLITAYLLLRVNCDKIMYGRWDFDASSAQTRRVSALDKHQNWSASALFCHNSQA